MGCLGATSGSRLTRMGDPRSWQDARRLRAVWRPGVDGAARGSRRQPWRASSARLLPPSPMAAAATRPMGAARLPRMTTRALGQVSPWQTPVGRSWVALLLTLLACGARTEAGGLDGGEDIERFLVDYDTGAIRVGVVQREGVEFTVVQLAVGGGPTARRARALGELALRARLPYAAPRSDWYARRRAGRRPGRVHRRTHRPGRRRRGGRRTAGLPRGTRDAHRRHQFAATLRWPVPAAGTRLPAALGRPHRGATRRAEEPAQDSAPRAVPPACRAPP